MSLSAIQQTREARERYLDALIRADAGDYEPLVKFCSSQDQKDRSETQCRMRTVWLA
ncbi:MAG: hypothetical protein HDQ91_01345 [Desulfovibrio sp.]|nr:hypothetical protein [Desulfovibrio sp.]